MKSLGLVFLCAISSLIIAGCDRELIGMGRGDRTHDKPLTSEASSDIPSRNVTVTQRTPNKKIQISDELIRNLAVRLPENKTEWEERICGSRPQEIPCTWYITNYSVSTSYIPDGPRYMWSPGHLVSIKLYGRQLYGETDLSDVPDEPSMQLIVLNFVEEERFDSQFETWIEDSAETLIEPVFPHGFYHPPIFSHHQNNAGIIYYPVINYDAIKFEEGLPETTGNIRPVIPGFINEKEDLIEPYPYKSSHRTGKETLVIYMTMEALEGYLATLEFANAELGPPHPAIKSSQDKDWVMALRDRMQGEVAPYLTFVFAPTRGSDARYPIEMGRWGLHIKYQHVNSYPKDSMETYKTGEIGSER